MQIRPNSSQKQIKFILESTHVLNLMEQKLSPFFQDPNNRAIIRDEILIQLVDNLFVPEHFLMSINNKSTILEHYIDHQDYSMHKLSIPNLQDPLIKNILAELYREVGFTLYFMLNNIGVYKRPVILAFDHIDEFGIYIYAFQESSISNLAF